MEERVGEQNHPSLLGITKRTGVTLESWSRKACDVFSEEILEISRGRAERKLFWSSALKDKT